MILSGGRLALHVPPVAQVAFQTLANYFGAYGYWVIFFSVLIENAGIPVPSETVLLFAGFLAYQGHLRFIPVVAVAIAGATLGDNLGYWIGHAGGRRLVDKFLRRFPGVAQSFKRSEVLFSKYGRWGVFTGRFVTGLRMFAGILAGIFKMPYRQFFFYNFSGATLWALVITSVGFAFGSRWPRLIHLLDQVDNLTLLLAGIGILASVVLYGLGRARRPSGFSRRA
jgi:membrane protein DedA with SNARE-associated domain